MLKNKFSIYFRPLLHTLAHADKFRIVVVNLHSLCHALQYSIPCDGSVLQRIERSFNVRTFVVVDLYTCCASMSPEGTDTLNFRIHQLFGIWLRMIPVPYHHGDLESVMTEKVPVLNSCSRTTDGVHLTTNVNSWVLQWRLHIYLRAWHQWNLLHWGYTDILYMASVKETNRNEECIYRKDSTSVGHYNFEPVYLQGPNLWRNRTIRILMIVTLLIKPGSQWYTLVLENYLF